MAPLGGEKVCPALLEIVLVDIDYHGGRPLHPETRSHLCVGACRSETERECDGDGCRVDACLGFQLNTPECWVEPDDETFLCVCFPALTSVSTFRRFEACWRLGFFLEKARIFLNSLGSRPKP